METAREAIIFAAIKGVRLHGLHGVRIRHISDIADILPSSIYGYFNGKEDLMQACFFYVCNRLADVICQTAEEFEQDGMPEKCSALWNVLFQWFVQHPDETLFFCRFCDHPNMTAEELCSSSCYKAYCDFAMSSASASEEHKLLSWLQIVLGSAQNASYIIRGILSDTAECRMQIYNTVSHH